MHIFDCILAIVYRKAQMEYNPHPVFFVKNKTYSESSVLTCVHPISQLSAIVLGCYKRNLAKLAHIWPPFDGFFHTPILILSKNGQKRQC